MNLQTLKTLFSPRRRIQGLSELSEYQGGRLFKQCVLSRGLCRYRVFDLEAVPAARRQDVLTLKIESWKRFDNQGIYVGWVGGTAHVWVWDADQVANDEDTLLPESVLHPAADGLRLVNCIDGFEGQCWTNGKLAAAEWWSVLPDSDEWVRFMRSAGLVPNEQLPAPTTLQLLDRPWARRATSGGNQLLEQERNLVMGGASLAAFVLCWQLVGLYLDNSGQSLLRETLEQRQRSLEPQLMARTQAFDNQAQYESLLELFPVHRQLQVMAKTAATLPKKIQLTEWSLEEDQLRLTLRGTSPEPSFYVGRFQDVDIYEEVTAERGRDPNELILNMTVNARLQQSEPGP
jgi:Tfp pilus assembly protein PilN